MDLSQTTESGVPLASSSRYRTVEDASRIALDAISMLDDVDGVKSRGVMRFLDAKPVKIISGLRSRGAINDTLMYVVNYADSMGFAIVSAVKGTPELIAVTMQGSYDPDGPSDNPGFNFYMDCAAEALSDGLWELDTTRLDPNGQIKPYIREKTVIDTVWVKRVAPKARVYWGQEDPEGLECPNNVCGCSNTAAAMAMCGLRYPTSIKLTYLTNAPTITLDWDAIKHHNSWDVNDYPCSCSQDTRLTIARLCRQLGYQSGTKYKVDPNNNKASSSTPTEGTANTLSQLGFNVTHRESISAGELAGNMYNDTEILVCGYRYDSSINRNVGHLWLCDGVKQFKLRSSYYRSDDSGLTWKLVGIPTVGSELIYNLFNWGWSNPSYIGYYLDMDFKAGVNANYNTNMEYIVIKR